MKNRPEPLAEAVHVTAVAVMMEQKGLKDKKESRYWLSTFILI